MHCRPTTPPGDEEERVIINKMTEEGKRKTSKRCLILVGSPNEDTHKVSLNKWQTRNQAVALVLLFFLDAVEELPSDKQWTFSFVLSDRINYHFTM